MEAEPVRFLSRELDDRLDAARDRAGRLRRRRPDDLAFVTNATSGVNAVLRSLALAPGDELLTTDHAYNACRNALEFVAERARRAGRRRADPLPARPRPKTWSTRCLSAVTPRTRLALLDHVTSPTALILPIERLIAELGRRGIDVLVDGAHAPGMLPARPRRARRRVLHRQLPQVALRAQGLGLSLGAARPPARGPAAHHQPRRQRDARRTARASTSSSTGRARAIPRPGSPCRRRSTTSARSCPAAGPR